MCEDKILVLLEGELVLLVLLAVWKVHSPKFRLNEEGNFMSRKCYIDFNWKSDAIRAVDLLV